VRQEGNGKKKSQEKITATKKEEGCDNAFVRKHCLCADCKKNISRKGQVKKVLALEKEIPGGGIKEIKYSTNILPE